MVKKQPGRGRMEADPTRKPGRPLLLTDDPDVRRRILESVRLGLSYDDAAKSARVGPSTFQEWRARGRTGEEPFATFLAEVEEAEAEGVEELFQRVTAAAAEDWRAAAWVLGARHRYVKPSEVKHTGAVATVTVNGDADPETRKAVLAVLGAHGYTPPDDEAE